MQNRLSVVVVLVASFLSPANSSPAATTTTTTTTEPSTQIVAKPKLPPKPPMSMGLPTAPTTLPFGLGVNIHFTNPKEGEMDQLAAAGFTFVRMDFSWSDIEKTRGTYDFSAYERLLDALAPHGIRALFILDYANPLYDDNLSPHTDAGREAFAKWAAAAVTHFKGRGILWEMYNEPNGFWRPSPNTGDYIKLALEVGKAIRSAAPDETYIGPAVAGMELAFLEACFQAGLLDYWSAVSVHPYRQGPPETVAGDYRKLRQLIARYAPKGKAIPIYSGEWGYSSAWAGYDEDKQGQMLPRQWLTNISNDVPVSIWYDWHDDGPDPKEPEHHFGTVHNDYSAKPAYLAAKTLTEQLAGYQFNKRLALPSDDDFLMLFKKSDGEQVKLVAWTAARDPHAVLVPTLTGTFNIITHTGQASQSISAENAGLLLVVGPTVQYLTPAAMNESLRRAASAERAPLEIVVKAPGEALGRTLSRGQESVAIDLPISSNGPTLSQRTFLLVANPLRLSILPPEPGGLPVRMENPSGERFFGTLRLSKAPGLKAIVNLSAGQTEMTVSLPLLAGISDMRVAAELVDDSGRVVIATPPTRFVSIDLSSAEKFDIRPDGDAKVNSTQLLSTDPEGSRGRGTPSLKLTYRFDAGWKYLSVFPRDGELAKVEGKPKSLGMWFRSGDGSGDTVRMRFTDSTGQTFQPDGPRLDTRDWRYVVFPLSAGVGHWGGAADGVIHYPIRLDSLFLLDSNRAAHGGDVAISAPVLSYEESPAPPASPATTKP